MARHPRYDVLFEPIHLGPKRMRNRFLQVPHCLGAGSDKPGFQAVFRATKAEGGWSAVFTEGASISPECDLEPFVAVRIWDEGDVRNLSLLCDKVHEHDALMGISLTYSGSTSAPSNETRLAPAWISATSNPGEHGHAGTLWPVDHHDIRRIRQLYVDAAVRAKRAGFDVIELSIAHVGSILARFIVPHYNDRTDEYGGSLENRSRFAREVLESVREAVGDDCACGIRFCVDTLDEPYGLGDQGVRANGDGHGFIEHMDDLVDYWNINIAHQSFWGEDAGPSRTHEENHQARYVGNVKEHSSKPVINVGRFTNPDTMVDVLESGQCDIIGAARPSIADPFLPKKIEEGRSEDVRKCIGCNICVSRWEQGGPSLICTQNPTSAEEFRRGWHPEQFEPAENRDNDVLIVGAGPSALECAIVLGRRGMRRVDLVDAEAAIGGCMRWVPKLPGLHDWSWVVDWRRVQLEQLKEAVTFAPQTELDAEGVLEYGAEIVVIATGSAWATDGLSGFSGAGIQGANASLDWVLTPEQVMTEGKPTGERVVVYDCDGYFMGHSLATRFAEEGKRVTLVTPYAAVAPYSVYTLESHRIPRELAELGVSVLTRSLVNLVQQGRVEVTQREAGGFSKLGHTDTAGRGSNVEIECDSVILATQRLPRDELFRELRDRPQDLAAAGIEGLYQIGDCRHPSFVAQAIFSGHRLGREIDSPDPSVALPFIRERRLIGSTEADYELGSDALSAVSVDEARA